MNVVIVSRLRTGMGNLREQLAGREDSKHVDALVRIALVLVICTMPYYGSVLLKRVRAAQDKAALANAAQRRLLAYSGDFEQSFHAITSSRSTAFRARSPEHFGRGAGA